LKFFQEEKIGSFPMKFLVTFIDNKTAATIPALLKKMKETKLLFFSSSLKFIDEFVDKKLGVEQHDCYFTDSTSLLLEKGKFSIFR